VIFSQEQWKLRGYGRTKTMSTWYINSLRTWRLSANIHDNPELLAKRIILTLEEEVYAELDKNIWKWSGLIRMAAIKTVCISAITAPLAAMCLLKQVKVH
jgi:hypothetical protein